MSLDQNLFTLNIQQREGSPLIIELVDPAGTVHYRKERTQNVGALYEFNVFGEYLHHTGLRIDDSWTRLRTTVRLASCDGHRTVRIKQAQDHRAAQSICPCRAQAYRDLVR